MNPNDYTSAFSGLQDPSAALMQGVQNGAGLQQLQVQQQQQQAALAQQDRQRQVIQSLIANPSAGGEEYANAMLQVPGMSEQLKQAWDTKSAVAQKQQLSDLAQWGAALQNNQPKIVVDGLNDRADAIENTAGGPTIESKALRAKAQAVEMHPEFGSILIKSMLAVHPQGKAVIDNIVAQSKNARDQNESDTKVAGENIDQRIKNLGIVAQAAGSLAKPGVKISQAQTMFRNLARQGYIHQEDLPGYLEGLPADPKDLPDYLNQVKLAGMKPDDQMKYTAPTADAKLSADTQRRGQDSTAQTAAARLAFDKDQAQGGDDASGFSPDAIDNAAGRYNVDGSLPALGTGTTAASLKKTILNRAAELKKGVDPTQQRLDQLNTKTQQRAMQDFTSGKLGSSVRSFNVGISHLDTLDNLADALHNKDTQSINRIGNYFATQTGSPAPTNFNAAKKIVGDEIVKAIVGAGGGVHDREEAARVIDAANSPEQLKGAINTYKELMVGQLGGLEKQYTASTGRTDFERFLSPQAQTLRRAHAPAGAAAPATPAIPTGWSVREH